jgi:hypothetical protein
MLSASAPLNLKGTESTRLVSIIKVSVKAIDYVRALGQIPILLVLSQSPAAAQDGLQLLHKMQAALGGSERIAAIHDYEESVQAETWNNEGKLNGEVRKRTRWIKPNCLRLDQVGPDDTYVLYFDGKSGWEILPDKSVLVLVGDELKFAEKYLFGLRLKLWLADRDSRYLVASPATNVIRISDKNGNANKLDITLDPVSSLPVKQTDGSTETRLEQWSAVQGIQFPHRLSMIKDGAIVAVIRVNKIELNRGLKRDELGEKPQDLKPVMAQRIP